jgi:hypothetical protein
MSWPIWLPPVDPGDPDEVARACLADEFRHRAIDHAARGRSSPLAAYPPDVGAVDLPAARLAIDETFREEYGELGRAVSPVAVTGDRIAAVVQIVTRAPWYAGLPFAVEVFTPSSAPARRLARALLSWSMRVLAEHGHRYLALRVVRIISRHGGFTRASNRGVELQPPAIRLVARGGA